MDDTTTRERRARRALDRMGLALKKSCARNPEQHSFGLYGILDAASNTWLTGPNGFELDLDEVEGWITT